MSNDSFQGHSKVEITKAKLISLASERTVDMNNLITKLEIYGSVFDPTMAAVMYILDSTHTVYNLPIIGEEVVELEIVTPGNEPLTKVMFVHRVSNVEFDRNGSNTSMRLDLVSIEQIRAISSNIHLGVKDQVSATAKHLLTDVLRVDEKAIINVEETEGIEQFVIPGWNIWQTMEFLCAKAVSTKYYSPYLFFESNKGFNFLSAEELIDQKKKNRPPETYTAEPFHVDVALDPNGGTIKERQRRNVDGLRILTKSNTLEMINRGGFNNTMRAFNLIRKEVVETNTLYADMSSNVRVPLDDKYNPQHSTRMKDIIGNNGTFMLAPVDNSNISSSVNNVGRRNMFARHFSDIEVTFNMYGNSGLEPGDLIKLEMPRTTGSPDEDAQLTGHYMITSFCHHIKDGQMMTQAEAFRFGLGSGVLKHAE